MKKVISVLILSVLLSFTTNDEKKYSLSWTPAETDLVYGALGESKKLILKSTHNIPTEQVLQAIGMIDSAQRLILKQIQPQLPKPEKK